MYGTQDCRAATHGITIWTDLQHAPRPLKWPHLLGLSVAILVLALTMTALGYRGLSPASGLWVPVAPSILRVPMGTAAVPRGHARLPAPAPSQALATSARANAAAVLSEPDTIAETAEVVRRVSWVLGLVLVAPALALGAWGRVPLLSRMKSWSMASISDDKAADATEGKDKAKGEGGEAKGWKSKMPNGHEWKKIFPLGLMSFCCLFSYTILRDTKDVLMITAPGSGAEVIPFLKTYVNLPGAILWTVAYSKLSNMVSQRTIFYSVVSVFIAYFVAFPLFIYPASPILHPHDAANALAAALPTSFMAPISLYRNWTFSMFYFIAEMWGSVVLSILFWGLANQICTVKEAKKYYPVLGFIANVAPILGGQYVRFASEISGGLPVNGMDPWEISLRWLLGGVVGAGVLLLGLYAYVQAYVMTDPNCVDPKRQRQSKQRTKLSIRESAVYLANSKYIRALAILVVAYGMSINIVEVTWKAKLKAQFPDPTSYSVFLGNFSSITGVLTVAMMVVSRDIFARFGWGTAAAITPITLGITGIAFFSLILAPTLWDPVTAMLNTTPLMLAVMVGAIQNGVSKAAKYSLFDPCKEMAYIPLDAEARTKGKAAIDVIGNPLGKSAGSFIQQGLIFSLGSLSASTPCLGVLLCLILWGWLYAANDLSQQFELAASTETEEPPRKVQEPEPGMA